MNETAAEIRALVEAADEDVGDYAGHLCGSHSLQACPRSRLAALGFEDNGRGKQRALEHAALLEVKEAAEAAWKWTIGGPESRALKAALDKLKDNTND